MIRIGTLCYVDSTCLAEAPAKDAIGRIVEVVSAAYEAPDWRYLPGTYHDVAFEGWTFYCHASKLRPISDPGADVDDHVPQELDAPVRLTPVDS